MVCQPVSVSIVIQIEARSSGKITELY